jgi:hypothetical protein
MTLAPVVVLSTIYHRFPAEYDPRYVVNPTSIEQFPIGIVPLLLLLLLQPVKSQKCLVKNVPTQPSLHTSGLQFVGESIRECQVSTRNLA